MSSDPRFSFVPVLDHELHVTEWGNPANPALVMWHGLARTGRDFDELARALSDRYFVLCPDTIGRGLSSWSTNPAAEYSVEYYAGIAGDLLDRYGITRAAWIGTSMGGLIGMRMASGPLAERLSCLIVNDIGPEIPQAAIDRILAYAGSAPEWRSMSEAEVWFRQSYQPFGPAADTFWRRMARTSVRRKGNGMFTLHYDPRITIQFSASPDELTTWDRWARIAIPVHAIRGADSDLFPTGVADRMAAAGPRAATTEIARCGHAPTLSRPQDIAMIRQILTDLGA